MSCHISAQTAADLLKTRASSHRGRLAVLDEKRLALRASEPVLCD